ncbi:helix-turn-helix domain-containing protein [Nocardia sp. CDC160]|uniref:helix-turn-helix domain-containing protein n=1 Tax=Nocardia sp. CDC160 TaxID=3112166 RepID=UPI002DB62343|nr:helix-turn-helix transcriptional regulator [Nocardia sp. CDC160]MEC3913278.1 helix-turn-helix transcriptional regulator [Nocardia sp. CDC160]
MAGLAASRVAFGSYIRELRTRSGKKPLAAGLEIDKSRQTVVRMENGYPTNASTNDIERLLSFYGASPEDRQEALRLWQDMRSEEKIAQQQGDSRGYWQPYADQVAAHLPRYLRLEAAANRVTTYQSVLVHGLLQTPEYRRAVTRIDEPDLSTVDTERRVELTVRRQERLNDPNFHLELLMSESVLRHRPGGPPVMAEQLRWLAEASRRDNISVRLVPFDAGSHRGLTVQPFTLIQFPSLSRDVVDAPVVYLESGSAGVYHSKPDLVREYQEVIARIREVALSESDAVDVILRIAKEYEA